MNEDTIRQRIETERALAERARREFIRWILLLAANINRPTHSTLRFLMSVVKGEYQDVTELQVRRELRAARLRAARETRRHAAPADLER